jgi:membrane fusion protein (multidrug efflux system)
MLISIRKTLLPAFVITLLLTSCSREDEAASESKGSGGGEAAPVVAEGGTRGGGREGGARAGRGARGGEGGSGSDAAVAGARGGTGAAGGGARAGRAGGRGGRGRGGVQPAEVIELARRDLIETITIVGSLAANESATIRPETSGLVREILFREGQQVQKGDLLLKIDDSEVRAQLEQAENNFTVAETNLARSRTLLQEQFATQAEFDRENVSYSTARANRDIARVRLNRTELRAPFDGVVNARSLSPGDFVSTQTVVTTIDDLSQMKVDFQVPERYLTKLRAGAALKVFSGSGESRVETSGSVYFVNSSIDRNTRAVQVKGLLTTPPPQLRPGMFSTVELVLEVRENVLTVPEGAILPTVEGARIIAVDDRGGESVARFVDVRLGLRARGLVEVTPLNAGDIEEGQLVIASGVGGLQITEGSRIDPRPLNPDFSISN